MDSIWNDPRIFIAAAGCIISALAGTIAKRLMGDINRLYDSVQGIETDIHKIAEDIDVKLNDSNQKTEKELHKVTDDVENVHRIVSGHIQYHQGLKDGGEKHDN